MTRETITKLVYDAEVDITFTINRDSYFIETVELFGQIISYTDLNSAWATEIDWEVREWMEDNGGYNSIISE